MCLLAFVAIIFVSLVVLANKSNTAFQSGTSPKMKRKQQNSNDAFHGKKYLCAYCGGRFNEAACPSCASTTYTETEEYKQWKNAVHVTSTTSPYGTTIRMTKQITASEDQKKFMKTFLIIFLSVFIGIWVLVLAILLISFLSIGAFSFSFLN